MMPGKMNAGKTLIPIIFYSLIYFVVVNILLTDDIKQCLRQIATVTTALSEKDYTDRCGLYCKKRNRSSAEI